MDYANEPLSPKTPGTLVRAKKGAVPLRQEIQDKVDALQRRGSEVDSADHDLGVAMSGLDQSLKELETRIKNEFSAMKTKLEEQMQHRCGELIHGAKEHFEKLSAVMAQQRELLGEEGVRVKACVEHAVEALGLDDAWFIQAYPDIQLEPGHSSVGRAREVLKGGNGSLALSFDERVMNDVLCPAVRGHGKLNSSLTDNAHNHNNQSTPYQQPVRSSPVYQSPSPRSPKRSVVNDSIADYIDDNRSVVSDSSVLESQVERMLKSVN